MKGRDWISPNDSVGICDERVVSLLGILASGILTLITLEDDYYCPRCTIPMEARRTHDIERPVCPRCGSVMCGDPKVLATVV